MIPSSFVRTDHKSQANEIEKFAKDTFKCSHCHGDLAQLNSNKPCDDLICIGCFKRYEVKSSLCEGDKDVLSQMHFLSKLKDGYQLRLGSKKGFFDNCIQGNRDLIIIWYKLKDKIGEWIHYMYIPQRIMKREYFSPRLLKFETFADGKKMLLKILPNASEHLNKLNKLLPIKQNVTRAKRKRSNSDQTDVDGAMNLTFFGEQIKKRQKILVRILKKRKKKKKWNWISTILNTMYLLKN